MFIHVLSLLHDSSNNFVTTENLNAWFGLTYSNSHSNRDMMAFLSANFSVMDLFSLFYAAPYLDIGSNIAGTNDLVSLGTSQKFLVSGLIHFFWSGVTRLYDTGDNNGD